MNPLIPILVQKTGIAKENIINILKLLEEGSTIPFIAQSLIIRRAPLAQDANTIQK